ncbi:MAG: alpha/beta fold hydrolase [Pseudomonadota bacterium]
MANNTEGRLVDIGEAKLYTETFGAGEPLLLVAGLGGVGKFWANQVELLSQHFQVILHDHRGVGRSSPAPVISGAESLADDLVALMDALEIEQAHLAGHSTGGAIGQHIALKHPQRLKSLVLSASWAGPTPLFIDTFKARRDVLINSGVRNYMMIGTLLAIPAWFLKDKFKGVDDYLAGRFADFPGLEVELGRLNAVMTHDLRHRVQEITTPTTVLCAQDDQLTPLSMSEELAKRIPGAALKVLDRGGHFCPVTNTADYNPLLLEALQAHAS